MISLIIRPTALATGVTAALLVGAAVLAGPASAAGTFQTTAAVNVRSGPGTGYSITGSATSGAPFVLQCQSQNGTDVGGNRTWDMVRFTTGFSGFITDFDTTTPSFNSYAPGTGDCGYGAPAVVTAQMSAAVNWATAEKNSPDPTWSDYFRHPWSGWCEQFAEQAEGFHFRFASATADYQAELAAGRIHSDAQPPPGALVFYGGSANGHVAVSIGGGQAIGTYGYAGQRLPVRQYPVVGFLSNPYLGWAVPFGS